VETAVNIDVRLAVILASTLACAVTSAGIYAISHHAHFGHRYSAYFMSFAAGMLISVSFLHIVPEAFEMVAEAPFYLLGGFLFTHLTNRFLAALMCDQPDCADETRGLLPVLGIAFHSFVDGIIFTVTFNVSILTGALAAIGMVLHEFPEGVVTFVLLQRAGFTRRRATWYAFLAAAISTPLGTVLSLPLISRIGPDALGTLLAFSGGVLVYVGASHLLPEVERENRRFSLLALMSGAMVALVIMLTEG
jgi:zinc transporter ZupT